MARTIRIYYIIPLQEGLVSWGSITRELMKAVAGPKVEITLADLPEAPVKSIMSEYHSELVAPLCIKKAIEAECGRLSAGFLYGPYHAHFKCKNQAIVGKQIQPYYI